MKKIKFYVCPTCGNILTATGEADLSCCGRKLSPLEAKVCDERHLISIDQVEDDFYATFDHPMSKDHYYTFAAYISYDKVLLIRLYPEQASELRFPKLSRGKLYLYCNQHGLFRYDQ